MLSRPQHSNTGQSHHRAHPMMPGACGYQFLRHWYDLICKMHHGREGIERRSASLVGDDLPLLWGTTYHSCGGRLTTLVGDDLPLLWGTTYHSCGGRLTTLVGDDLPRSATLVGNDLPLLWGTTYHSCGGRLTALVGDDLPLLWGTTYHSCGRRLTTRPTRRHSLRNGDLHDDVLLLNGNHRG